MLKQMFEVTSSRFHAAMLMFVSLIDSRRSLSLKAVKASSVTRQRALGAHQLSILNRDVAMFHCCNMKKLNLILKLKVPIHNEQI